MAKVEVSLEELQHIAQETDILETEFHQELERYEDVIAQNIIGSLGPSVLKMLEEYVNLDEDTDFGLFGAIRDKIWDLKRK